MHERLTYSIPLKFLDWLVSSRTLFLNDLKKGKPLKYFSAHLPVMATWSEGEDFPVNMTVKGIGLVPKKEKLEYYTDIFEAVLAEAKAKSWDASFEKRVEAAGRLYCNIENFDTTMLGGLEIFEGQAFKNLRETPLTSLLYTGMMRKDEGMEYISFQINGKVEILQKDNPYYKFLLASRKLFEFDKFHLYQLDYPFGYLVNVIEVRDKSPFHRPSERHN